MSHLQEKGENKTAGSRGPLLWRGLSVRLLVLTVAFVMLSEVLIYVPSIARFRQDYIVRKLGEAHLASLALLAAPNNQLSAELGRELLFNLGARGIVLKRPETRFLMLSESMPPEVDATFDMSDPSPLELLRDTVDVLFRTDARVIRVLGAAPRSSSTQVEVIFDEKPLREAMRDFSWRILTLSIIISLLTAGLVYVSLLFLLVRPMARITESMIRFRKSPEDVARVIVPSRRRDEVGIAEQELAEMQRELRDSLRQKTRLAALGTAVSKINHDLRNILAVAQLVSDRFAASADPEVQRMTPRLIDAVDRAINLCTRTLKFGRADEPEPQIVCFPLRLLVDEVGTAVVKPGEDGVAWVNRVPDELEIFGDQDQLYRVLLNLGRNAAQALGGGGEIVVSANPGSENVEIDVADNGPGLPPAALEHLFEPFTGSARAGGTGLGLVIARDLMRAHGGSIKLVRTGSDGTVFRITLPCPENT